MTSPRTEYGTWVNFADPQSLTVGDDVKAALEPFAEDFRVDDLTEAYRAAINEHLEPHGITLAGERFFGPSPRPGNAAELITAAIRAADFWVLAPQFDATS